MNIPLCKGQPWHRIFIVQRAAFQPRDITPRYSVVGHKTLIALLLLACASTAGATQINLNLGPRQTYTWGGWVFYNLRGYESTLPGKLTIDFGAPVRTRGAFVMDLLFFTDEPLVSVITQEKVALIDRNGIDHWLPDSGFRFDTVGFEQIRVFLDSPHTFYGIEADFTWPSPNKYVLWSYLDMSSPKGFTVHASVPDSGSTILLLVPCIAGLALLKNKQRKET